jgi:hypothetical protein
VTGREIEIVRKNELAMKMEMTREIEMESEMEKGEDGGSWGNIEKER